MFIVWSITKDNFFFWQFSALLKEYTLKDLCLVFDHQAFNSRKGKQNTLL